MITKQQRAAVSGRRAGLALLALGAVLGWLVARRASPADGGGGVAAAVPAGPFAADEGVPPALDLTTLELTFAPADAATLQAARDQALAQGVILQETGAEVPATVRAGAEVVQARVRIKGDWTDHVDTDKWSLRIEVDGAPLLGMSRFSIQHPKTRGFLMEWLMLETARREGLLAPRCDFVQVLINGRNSGVYFLEEHFTKELLESQGRRDGPIVRFGEDTLWRTWLQHDFRQSGRLPLAVAFAGTEHAAEVGAFNERRFASVPQLNERLQRALGMMRDLQLASLAEQPYDRLLTLQALAELQGRTIDQLFVADKLGQMLALYSLMPADHGLAWHALRFYHDPVLDRLEPVLFNTGARLEVPTRDLAVLMPQLAELARSDRVYEATFRSLIRLGAPGYVGELRDALGPRLLRHARVLQAEGLLPPTDDVPAIFARLERASAEIRRLVAPDDAVNFDCRLVPPADADDQGGGTVEVEAWATTRVPVVVESFRFSNGREVPAASTLTIDDANWRRDGGVVALPHDGRHLLFRFPVDARLAHLHDIADVKAAARQGLAQDRSVKVELFVRHRTLATAAATEEQLAIRRGARGNGEGRRPPAPSLRAALEHHECLGYDLETDRLFVRPGVWTVDGDLIVPDGHRLTIAGGTTLRFGAGAVLLAASPLEMRGASEYPVVLEASDVGAGWGALVVTDSVARSHLEHVVIRDASAVARGAWQTTGGVTFYRAPVDMVSVRIERARGEDALNVVGSDLTLSGCSLEGGASDLFDGDFVTAVIRDCSFAHSGEDALDFSGSRVSIEKCSFTAIGDKAFSIGEQSVATIRDCTVRGTSIGLAAKDNSRVEADGLDITGVVNYVIAAYIKKPEFGPSTVVARRLTPATGDSSVLVQEGCSVAIDGHAIAGKPVDVELLYEQKILGK